MNSNLATIDLQTGSQEIDVSASGAWTESFINRPENMGMVGKIGQIAGLVLAIAASPATVAPDFWFFDRRRCDSSTATWVIEGIIGRPISRAEALWISRQVLERAERERIELAEWEAMRGLQWEEGE